VTPSPAPHLNEWRGLRQRYLDRAAVACHRRYPMCSARTWSDTLTKIARNPNHELAAGFEIYVPQFHSLEDWSAVTRFLWLSQKCFELECEALADHPYATARTA
jgi:hypothetical protein